jgi:hypothetical protein
MNIFDQEGVSFQYPENWQLEQEETDEGWTVSVQSPGTAFLTLTCDSRMPAIEEVAEAVLGTMQEEYPTLEAEPIVDTVAGQPAVGHDMQFFSFDLTNTCWTRSFYGGCGTVLVLCQTSDLESEQYEPVLRAICASLRLEE